ncbi:MAG TPA: sigma-54 dependent transcriptional regulator [Candidatus Udaeobacter sp.]|nr:sigma-54 dependent transcriptional regulator [Candidatus Udaeobacter sp.]
MEPTRPWATCYLTDILLSYVRESLHKESEIDDATLFRGTEGIELPSNPQAFLADVRNWVPLSVLRELELQCEKISGRKDIAYHAAKAYFVPGKRPLPSLFDVILQVLNEVRSALIFASLWAASQTNYLKLQTYERPGRDGLLYILAQFDSNVRPTIGAINLLRGFCEGFPQLYPFVEKVTCAEEISQLRLDDILREFPDFQMEREGDSVIIYDRVTKATVAKAEQVRLQTEAVALSSEFTGLSSDHVVIPPQNGRIEVLLRAADKAQGTAAASDAQVYRITSPGVISNGSLIYSFEEGQICDAPYSRFRVAIEEQSLPSQQISAERLRREVSRLLFEHLKQAKQNHTRVARISDEKRLLTVENNQLRREIERDYSFAGIIGRSEKLKDLTSLIRSAAETDVTVLIQGETGTGKELIARAIHYNSPRSAKKFVAVNCGALSETLLESELFGHEKGAFTGAITQRKGIFESADGGTLFLDEIGEISKATQVKLLRVLQEGELQRVGGSETIKVDVRIVAATNQDFAQLMKQGQLRQDLFYRLNVFPISVPPLRERLADIPLLVTHFIEKGKQKLHKGIAAVSRQAMALMMAHSWPGNIRELENAVQRMMVMSKGDLLDVDDLPPEIRGGVSGRNSQPRDLKEIARESSELIEKRAIVDALEKSGGNVTRTARSLGISRATLQNKMKAYRLKASKE